MRSWGLPQGTPHYRHLTALDTYVIKLFDRSVDLAQFSENTPLYPICRAWMRNSPTVRECERSPGSPLPPLPEDGEVGWVSGGQTGQWVDKSTTPQLAVDRQNLWAPSVNRESGQIALCS